MRTFVRRTAAIAALLVVALPAIAQQAGEQTAAEKQAQIAKLAKAAQNPVADMVSIPFQFNSNFNTNTTQNTLNIQPVYPVSLNKEWNVITRTILPIVWQPTTHGDGSYYSGLGSINFSAMLSPKAPGKVIWGGGLAINFPSTSPQLSPSGGSRKWSAGPSAVALMMPGKFVLGILANQTWSFAGPSDVPYWSLFYSQVFINYNLDKGWYLTMAPVITANWTASSDNVWTVPLGGGFGRLVKLGGKLPVNMNVSAYGYVVKPTGGPDWTLRVQVALLLPKG